MTVFSRARHVARSFGLEVQRATPTTAWRLRLPKFLEQHRIGTVLDVGANDGGFARELLDGGFRGQIYSFEPLPDAWEALRAHSLKYADRWSVFPRVALSDEAGEAEFFEAGNSVSSSLLNMTQEHIDGAPSSAPTRTLRVPVQKLDDVLPALGVNGNVHLKIDVQGAEKNVLQGAMQSLRGQIVGVQLEMSLTTLYDGQALAHEIDALLTSLGFALWDIVPGFRNAQSLRLLQYDGIYFRT